MKAPTLTKLDFSAIGFDSAILSALPFPALICNIHTGFVLQSNSFFHNENNCHFLSLLVKHNYDLLSVDDFQQMSQDLMAGQNYAIRKKQQTAEESITFDVHACILQDRKNIFLYLTQLSTEKLIDLSCLYKEWGSGPGIIDLKYRTLVDQLPIGIYRTTAKGEFVYANPALARILEVDSVKELYQISVNDLFLDKSDRKKQLERWKKVIINSEEFRLVTRKGRLIHVKDIGLGIFNTSGEIEYFDGIIEDITDRVTMEQEIRTARDKALEADRLKTTFLTNMSHEIRTPMNSILGFSTMLKGKIKSNRIKEQYLDIIIARSKHLMHILNDILDLTRIDEGQILRNPVSFYLNDFLDQLKKVVEMEVAEINKPLNIQTKMPLPKQDSLIITDQNHLHRILSNLLDNSIKFSEEGFIEFGYKIEPKDNIVFYVKDTGIGIPKNLQETIFERFRQVDESFTRDYGGLGLGLSICKGLVQLMGGNIWVESDEHKGSTFYFTVNYSRDNSIQGKIVQPLKETFAFRCKNKCALIVEDDSASFEYLNEVLLSIGCEVLRAKNGTEALEIFSKAPKVDIILLDIQVPEMDGYEIAKSIRKMNVNIPIIAQTAHAFTENKKKCFEAGCNQYLTKPIHYDTLINTLKGYLT